MRFAVITVGSRGDVRPYVLRAAGRDVCVVTYPLFEDLIHGEALDFGSLGGAPFLAIKAIRTAVTDVGSGRRLKA